MHHEGMLKRALAGTGDLVDFSGNWQNELGSTMTITQENGRLSGTYTSQVSAAGNQTVGDLVGFVDGDLFSLVVHWRDFQAITTWVGQLVPNAEIQTIKALWQMVKQVEIGNEWTSINAGADEFKRRA